MRRLWRVSLILVVFVALFVAPAALAGDSDNPLQIYYVNGFCSDTGGLGLVSSSTGLLLSPTGTLHVAIPSGTTVVKAFLYWNGDDDDNGPAGGAQSVTFAGHLVSGTNIGGPAFWSTGRFAYGYRADVTSYVTASQQDYTIDVGGGFEWGANGAELIVVYRDSAKPPTIVETWDGLDLGEGHNGPASGPGIHPIVFSFDAAAVDRQLAVETGVGGAESGKATNLYYKFGTGTPPSSPPDIYSSADITRTNPYTGADGARWDTYKDTITVPAGKTYVIVQPESVSDAQLEWVTAAFEMEAACPHVAVAKTLVSPSDGTALVNDQVQYRINITNTGNTNLVTIPVEDTYDTNFLSYSTSTLTPDDTTDDGTLNWSDINTDLAPNGTASFLLIFTAENGTQSEQNDQTINHVSLSGVTDQNNHTAETVQDDAPVEISNPSVEVSKTLHSPTNGVAVVGEPVQFQIVVHNTGDTRLDQVPLDDSYDAAYLTFDSATPNVTSSSAGSLHWNNVGPLDAGASKTITVNFTAKAVTDSLNNKQTENKATVTNATDENSDQVSDGPSSAPVRITEPDVSVEKSLIQPAPSDGVAVVGEPVQFQIVVQNTGDTRLDTIPLDDSYSATYLTFDSALPNVTSSSAGSLHWNNVGPLDAGASKTITVNFKAKAVTDSLNNKQTENKATVTDATDENGDKVSDGPSSAPVRITNPSYAIQKTLVDPTNSVAVVGEQVTYRIAITNTGDTAIAQMALRDGFDTSYLDYASASSAPDSIDEANGLLDWNNLITTMGTNLLPGQTFLISVTFTTTAPSNPNAVSNVATASNVVDENGDSVPQGQGEDDVLIVTSPALQITKTIFTPANGKALVGDTVTYKIVIANTGDTRIDVLPLDDTYDGTILQYVTATVAPTSSSSGSLHWDDLTTALGDVAPGNSVQLTVTFTAIGSTHGADSINTAATNGATDQYGDNIPNDSDTASVKIWTPASIGDTVWHDEDRDGTQNGSEIGIPSVTMRLYLDDGDDVFEGGTDDVFKKTTTTNGNTTSNYLFDHLFPGSYWVDVDQTTLPAGMVKTGGNPEPELITVAEGDNYLNADYGYDDNAALGDFVWEDANGDGTQQTGETTGIPDVTITVRDAAHNIVATKVTDSNGYYHVIGLPPGTYVTTVSDKSGYVLTSARTITVTLAPTETKNTVDFGFITPTAVQITRFDATASADSVTLRWQTMSEDNVSGFQVWRRLAGASDWTLRTEQLIPAQGIGGNGASYAYQDNQVAARTLYEYELRTMPGAVAFGPIRVRVPGRLGPGSDNTNQIFMPLVSR